MARDGGRPWSAILAGAIVGVPMGAIGLAIGRGEIAWLSVGFGSACGGATAAALSDRGVRGDVGTAATADGLRSVSIALLFALPPLLSVDGPIEALLAAGGVLLFGTVLGGPIALVSMAVAVLAGLATALLKAAVR